jgi:hypothetical protein
MSDHGTVLGGTCSARFDPLRELFEAKLESGEDLGASIPRQISVPARAGRPDTSPASAR